MLTRRKRYQLRFTRAVLLAGYLFLFAGQVNGHYFGLANFYVFEHTTTIHARIVVLHDNSQQPAHLAVDKRFQPNQGIRVLQIHAPHAPYCTFTRLRLAPPLPAYSSMVSPTNSLRGPPRV